MTPAASRSTTASPKRFSEPSSSTSLGNASLRDVLKTPTSADGDWLTRDGRRIALAASALPE